MEQKKLNSIPIQLHKAQRVISQEVAWLGMEYIKAYCKVPEISKIINEIKLDAKKAINFNSEKLRTYAALMI
ncbi:hypothetical protein [Mycoplasmopsis cynos]|uniref:hypothetical protein n=1 Tax=Mycoplasmopsis cynos TaxID=171284 RepID=UPI00220A9BB4|nr:hypothetical protein [Mycoplasmopsis cynos]UWV82161.1 hypothetical protein NW065_00280 [Mycoplasmopsis cynos]